MKKLIVRIFLFCIVFFAGIFGYIVLSSEIVKSRDFKIYNTDSNTLPMSENERFDIIFSGASHARNFSRHKNHQRVEQILEKDVTNLGQGVSSCGVEEQYFYLKYFYSRGNQVDKLFYILSTPLLYSETLPIASNTFNKEVFSLDFLLEYISFEAKNKTQRVFEYLRSKLSLEWLTMEPFTLESMDSTLARIDMNSVEEGFLMYYGENPNESRFLESCRIIESEVLFAKKHSTETIFIIPPAVFGKWPGHEKTIEFAAEMSKKYGCRYLDFSESILDPQYYYDHHHLNTKGVVKFTNILKENLASIE